MSEKFLHCWSCNSDRVIGFRLRSIWDGRVAYDLECDACGTTGSITKENLDASGLEIWKTYGEHGDWKCGSLPCPTDRWWDERPQEMRWYGYWWGIVLLAYSEEDDKVLRALAKTLPKEAASSYGDGTWELGETTYKDEDGEEPCYTYLKFER